MKSRHAITYVLLVGLPVGILVALFATGSVLTSPGTADALTGASESRTLAATTGLLIAQVAVILLAARIVGRLFRSIGQPQVVGEMAAGILLGPSVMGWVAPGASTALFDPGSLGGLGSLSDIGLVLFMFVVGLDLDTKVLRTSGRAALVCSHASSVVPFVLGAVLALYFYDRLAPPTASFVGFALFLGAAMSITAFPVLARILADQNLSKTRIGSIALARPPSVTSRRGVCWQGSLPWCAPEPEREDCGSRSAARSRFRPSCGSWYVLPCEFSSIDL